MAADSPAEPDPEVRRAVALLSGPRPADMRQALTRLIPLVPRIRHRSTLTMLNARVQDVITGPLRHDDAAMADGFALWARIMIAAVPEVPDAQVLLLTEWGNRLLDVVRDEGDLRILAGVILLARTAAGIPTTIDPTTHHLALLLLGQALRHRYFHLHVHADLAESVDVARRALDGLPAGADDLRADLTRLLVAGLRTRSLHVDDRTALAEAVERQRALLAGSGPAGARRGRDLALLAEMVYRSDTGASAAADEAAGLYREALRTAPEAEEATGGQWHSSLGHVLSARARMPDGTDAHFAEAVDVLRTAVEAAPASSVLRSNAASALAEAERWRSELAPVRRTTAPAATGDAIGAARSALAALPPGDPGRLNPLVQLGYALGKRFHQTSDPADRDAAIRHLREATRLRQGNSHARFLAAAYYGALAAGSRDWTTALDGYRAAVDTLPAVLPDDLARGDQERAMTGIPQIGPDAASIALRAGADPATALRLLERGHGVLLAKSMRAEVPADGRPDLLDAVPGPLVVLNESGYGSYAFILSGGDCRVLPLGLDPADVAERTAAFRMALQIDGPEFEPAHRYAAARLIDATLAWMWDHIAEPVLTELGHTKPVAAGERAPRVWWMPTGMLTHLPLHAAGRHRTADRRTVLDRVMSSYTPTLRLLNRARPAPDPSALRPLVVAVPDAAGRDPLPGVTEEAAAVRRRFPGAAIRSGRSAGRAEVLAALRGHDWVHLACHAVTDDASPSASHLLLSDGALRVTDIDRLDLPGAYLAYLSACGTAQSGVRLADQAVHVSSAFQLAGFTHVVATLWPVGDRAAVAFGDAFYAALHPADPAAAVHAATVRLRERHGGRSVLSWAGHIHTGP